MSTPDLFGFDPSAVPVGKAPSARQLRDDGIARAERTANKQNDGWALAADGFIVRYATVNATLTAEEVRQFAYAGGLPKPDNERSWGGAFVRARKSGVIAEGVMEKAKDPKVHCSYMMRWRSLICVGV